MSGAIPPLPQYAFMAWCSVKKEAQGQLYFLPLISGMYTDWHKASMGEKRNACNILVVRSKWKI
jgi:hypothetical protein